MGSFPRRIEGQLLVWLGVILTLLATIALQEHWPWLVRFPAAWTLPINDWINVAMEAFIAQFQWVFRSISWLLGWPMRWTQAVLQSLPWPATIFAVAVLAYAASGWRLAAFSIASMLYMAVTGYWSESMNTLALVAIAVPIAVIIGLLVGIAAHNSPRINAVVQPTLDLMQTVPTFAYLVPILLLFGFGPVVGLIASAIYACPPMVRTTILGLQRVPFEVIEAGMMSGTTRRQLLWMVRIPSALPTLMIGVNQTLMAGLAMVIIAAIIGSSADIGWEVLSTMRRARFGESLLSGLVIVLIAMVMDRISRGFAVRSSAVHRSARPRYHFAATAVVGILVLSAVAQFVEPLAQWPSTWEIGLAQPINDGLQHVLREYSDLMDTIKRWALFFVLLPFKIGLESTIRPASWGFTLTPGIIAGYAVSVSALAGYFVLKHGWRGGIAILLLGCVLYFGITKIPWPAFIVMIGVLAFQVGGWRLGAFATLGLLFMLLAGVWPQTMLTIYLCSAAVAFSFLVGGALGIWAAENDRISLLLRPINDTLQTIPLFVFLIPVLMFFGVGEFTAFLAIIMYAIVPAIRYTEHGLRAVSAEVVDAATSFGCTRWQLLRHVKLPLAVPEIMLGLNQTIMFGLAMLVITALVGTRGLGQSIYIALGQADPGAGIVAGLCMALIAMIADRTIQAWSHKSRVALGLSQ